MQTLRITAVLLCLVVSFAVVGWMRLGYNEIVDEPEIPLTALPMQLGSWIGVELAMPDETAKVLDAFSSVNRTYSDSNGTQISLHSAVWLNADYVHSAPHHPEVCYPAAGWQLIERRPSTVSTPSGEFPVELMHFKKDLSEVVTCHWFQMGDVYYRNAKEFQGQRSQFWGAKSWPPSTKYLLSTANYSLDRAEPILQDFASRVHEAMLPNSPPADAALSLELDAGTGA